MGFETQDVERKVLAILNALEDSHEAVGSTVIAKRLKDMGIGLSERAVRYHLRLMDERGLTRLVGRRDGRLITAMGEAEIKKAMVSHKVGLTLSRIEMLAFRTNIDLDKREGIVPANVSYFNKEDFSRALKVMKPIFKAGLCISDLVMVAHEGENLGEVDRARRQSRPGYDVQYRRQRNAFKSRRAYRLQVRRCAGNKEQQANALCRAD